MSDRTPLDDLTSDNLDALYDRLAELTAGQCTHYLGTHQQCHSEPVPGCPYPGCVTQPPDRP
jgi:hypothetical protein